MQDFKQVDCFKSQLKIWKYLGVYPLAISRPSLYALYSKIFISFFIILYSGLFTINLYFIPNSLENYIEDLILYFTALSIMSKALTFFFKKNKIENIINSLESDIFQPKSNQTIKIINKTKSTNQLYWKIYSAVCLTSHYANILIPLVYHFIFKAELSLPICSYYFLSDNMKNNFIYPLYFYQSIGMTSHVLFTINIDTFFVGLMKFLIAHLKILEIKLINVTEDFEIVRAIPQHDADLILELNKVLVHYEEVTKFCNLVEDVFSIALFLQFGMGSYIICLCLIRFTMPVSWQYVIFLSTYTFVMVVQILVPCWFGTRIMDKSCQLAHALYSCDWTPRSKRFKTSMRLFVERANRPLSITGWKMFPLSLPTFTSIMNTAYSFFTLLRHMQSR